MEGYQEVRSRNCTFGENGISRNGVNIRHTGKECVYPGSVHGIAADLRTMDQEQSCVMGKITVSVHSRREKDLTVTCQLLIISEPDILSVNF